MNAKILIAAILGLFITGSAFAQVTVFIGTPPLWGPVGYNNVQYYYLPDVESYYDVYNSRFIYYEGGNWVHRKYLPLRYRRYNLYDGYKVVMSDYRGTAPYSNFRNHRIKYAKGYKGQHQKTVGIKPDHWNKAVRNAEKSHSTQKASPGRDHKDHGKRNNSGGKGKKK
ncbi:MAG: hypothetical protein AB9834_14110 [Lentimicrobium sp.]